MGGPTGLQDRRSGQIGSLETNRLSNGLTRIEKGQPKLTQA